MKSPTRLIAQLAPSPYSQEQNKIKQAKVKHNI